MRNKKKCFFGMLVLVLLLVSRLAFAPDFVYLAKVERIIDGDTIVVDLYLGLNVMLDDQYIRLYGIDAWETRGEENEENYFSFNGDFAVHISSGKRNTSFSE